jgi:hypothetical protein
LLELDGIKVSVEMVRRIQIDLGLWRPKTRKARRVFQLRQRRPRFGELIQIDGSPHDWFEGRGPRCTLIVFIDDATGWPTALRFAPVESIPPSDPVPAHRPWTQTEDVLHPAAGAARGARSVKGIDVQLWRHEILRQH